MRALLQRVTGASVETGGRTVGAIRNGFLILFGAAEGDTPETAEALAEKTARLRVFPDGEGKMNRSILETGGEALVVPQFTLYADARKGNRPSFFRAAGPEPASFLFGRFMDGLRKAGVPVECGVFGAHMRVSLVNDGPVTILLDSEELRMRCPEVKQ